MPRRGEEVQVHSGRSTAEDRADRPSHPRWPAIILLAVVTTLLVALSVLSTFGPL